MVLLWILFMMTGMVSLHIQLALAVPTTTEVDSVSETSTQNPKEELDEIKNNDEGGGGGEEGVEEEGEQEEEEVPIALEDEDHVVVGDMIMTVEDYQTFSTGIEPRKGVKDEKLKWMKDSNGIPTIPYIRSGEGKKYKTAISGGIQHWESNTCIRFRQKTEMDKSYLFFYDRDGCYTRIGRFMKDRQQVVYLNTACQLIGQVVHILGHAIGFMHEHQRQDRDKFIRVNDMNVKEKFLKNFKKDISGKFTNNLVEYDFTSAMHHGITEFSKNGRLTVRTVNPMYQGLPGRFTFLSHRDKLAANRMYGCLEFWLDKCDMTKNHCENTGYIGSNCECICPPGTEGETCQDVIGDYYSEVMSSCNMNITTSNTIIKTPNYPQQVIDPDTWCVYHIMAPKGSQIQIKFVDFELDTHCPDSYLMIMEDKAENVTDTVACGKDFTAGQVHNTTTNEVIMYMDISKDSLKSKGFHAVVSFSTGATMTLNPVGVGILTLLLIFIFMH